MTRNGGRGVVGVLVTFGLIVFFSGLGQQAHATSNPVPYISSTSPVTVAPGSAQVTLTVNGTNFVSGSLVVWIQHQVVTTLATTYVGPDRLTAVIPATDLATYASALIEVVSPGPNNTYLVSNEAPFTVTPSTGTSQAALVFRLTAQSPSAGNHPNIPIFADLNGDGILDLAVSNQNQGNGYVSIFYGLGGGAFSAATNYPVADGPEGMAVGDFNNDGYLDLAVVDMNNSSYSILLGSADGTFTVTTTDLPVTGTFPYAIVAGDFNQDGKLDLAVACQDPTTGGFVYILLGNGDGTFSSPLHYGSLGTPEGLVTADFNGDGYLDLAVSDYENNDVWVLTGNGDGTFSSGTPYSVAPASGAAGLVANDFNGDGQTDLAVSDITSGGVTVFLNSSGTFTQTSQSPIAAAGGYFVGSADLSGDNIQDLAVADYSSNTFSALFGNGDGTFQTPPVSYTVDPKAQSILGLALASVTANGRFDVVTTDLPNEQVEVLLQTATLNPNPSSVTFPNTDVGTTSSPMTVTLENSGSAPLIISAISSSDSEFAESNTCGSLPATLWVDASCVVTVTFAPSTYNTRSATLSIDDNASATAQTVALSGVGLEPVASLTGTLNFPNQFEGTSSSALMATLTNSGNAALTITGIGVTGAYSETNTCGSSVGAGASCSISVTFKPTTQGTAGGTLTVTDDSGFSSSTTQVLSMTGTGIGPTAAVAPVTLTFGSQLVGTTSTTQTVTLSNSGTAALTITSVAVGGTNGGDFSQTNTCGTSLNAGANCVITVTFKPTATGTRSGTVTVTDNTGGITGSIQTATLTGTAVAPVASVTPSSLPAFAGTLVGSSSSPQIVTLSNTGSAALTITSVAIGGTNSGDFSQTNNCGTSVATGANCTVNVTFKPAATGSRTGTLTLTDNNNAVSGSAETVSLTGTGTAPVVSLSSLPAFGNQLVGTKSATQAVTLSNTGTAALTITGIALSGTGAADFSETNTCGTSVAAGSNCTISLTFDPATLGAVSATLTVTDNNNAVSGSAQTLSLTGTGTGPAVTLSATSLTFPSENVGTASVVQPVTITNSGTATLSLTGITVSGDFSISNPCGTSLAVGAMCTVNVTFKPTAIGSRTGAVTITDNATTGTQTVSLGGTGLGSEASLSASSLTWGPELVGVTSAAQSVTLKNTGNAAMTVTGMTASGDFAQTNACGSSVAAGASCTVNVTFAAKAGGALSGTLTLTDSSLTGNQTVALSGTGQDFTLTATTGSASVSAGQTATYNLTLTPVGGLNEAVALSCTGLASSSEASCTVSPSSVTPTAATPVTVTVTTTAPSHLLPISHPRLPLPGGQVEWLLIALLGLAGMTWLAKRRPRAVPVGLRVALATACIAVVLAIGMAACGGSGSSITTTASGGTPTGNYSITVTGSATSGSVTDSHNVALTMTVQ